MTTHVISSIYFQTVKKILANIEQIYIWWKVCIYRIFDVSL